MKQRKEKPRNCGTNKRTNLIEKYEIKNKNEIKSRKMKPKLRQKKPLLWSTSKHISFSIKA